MERGEVDPIQYRNVQSEKSNFASFNYSSDTGITGTSGMTVVIIASNCNTN